MAERLLITKVKRTSQTAAELYGARHKYADLRLFDLGELAQVGMDPTALQVGEETPARFWAVYELSAKTNKAGNPYRDVIALEPIAGPATATSAAVGDSSILAEVRAIRALLEVLATAQGLALPTPTDPNPEPDGNGHDHDQGDELNAAFPRFGNGATVPDAAIPFYAEHVKAVGTAPADVDALRAWVKAQPNGK